MNFQLLILMIIAIGFFYVMVPVVLTTYRQFRGPRTVVCPETGSVTEIELDAWHAAATAIPGPSRLHVVACARWPERAGCREACLTSPAKV
jgi:hypothetical protein